MGNYLAIPHGTNESKESIKRSALSVIRYDQPIDWDGNDVRFAMGIAGYQGGHMDILSSVAILFSDTDEVDKLARRPIGRGTVRLLNAVNEEPNPRKNCSSCSTRSTKSDRGRAGHRHQVMRRPSCTGSVDFLEVTRRSARTPGRGGGMMALHGTVATAAS